MENKTNNMKEYMKEYNKKYYQEHKEKIKENVRKWTRENPEKVAGYIQKSNNSSKTKIRKDKWSSENIEKVRKSRIKHQNIYAKENPQIIYAQNLAEYHIPLKSSCEICNSDQNLQRHHWNYNKPLLVNTLCGICHQIQHVKNFSQSKFAGGNLQ